MRSDGLYLKLSYVVHFESLYSMNSSEKRLSAMLWRHINIILLKAGYVWNTLHVILYFTMEAIVLLLSFKRL